MMAHVEELLHRPGPYLSDLLPSLSAQWGLGGRDLISVKPARRYVVVLVDGLGWDLALTSCARAPYIAGLIGDAERVAVVLPSTTAASLMSLWTGRSPGEHGLLGFTFRSDQGSEITWPLYLEAPLPTAPSLLDRCAGAGIAVSCVMPAEYLGSGLTQMSSTHAQMIGVDSDTAPARLEAVVAAARRGERSLTYVYERRLDATGHRYGVASEAWFEALTAVDNFLEALRARLDDEVCLLVTGDHGMVDIAAEDRVVIDDDPILSRDLDLVAGEARFRHLYTAVPQAVAARWRERLAGQAVVATRDEAIEAGVFGPVAAAYRRRIGDVVVIATHGQAYLSTAFAKEKALIGMHGGATIAERFVPVLVD